MSKGSDFYGSIFLINSKLKSHRTESAVPALPESGTFAQENGEAMILPVPLASENLPPTSLASLVFYRVNEFRAGRTFFR